MNKVDALLSDVVYYTIVQNLSNSDVVHVISVNKQKVIQVAKVISGEKRDIYVFDIYSMLPQNLKRNYKYLDINRIDGIGINHKQYTLFLCISFRNFNYVYQLNIEDEYIVESIPITKLYETQKIYLGLNITNIYKETDYGETVIKNYGLLYVDSNNPKDVSGKYIRKIKVAITKDEKKELEQFTDINTPYPITDLWNKDTVVYRLPSGVVEHEFDFSAGLGKLTLND